MIQVLIPLLIVGAAMALFSLLAPRFSTGCLLTVISISLAFLTLAGLALGDCATAECRMNDDNRPLWALGIALGTAAANVAMWLLISRRNKADS